MELIKKIKETEAQAQKIKEDAKSDSARQAEKMRQKRQQLLEDAEQERIKAIESSVAEAEKQGLEEGAKLKAQADKDRQQLREKTKSRVDAAVAKVMDYLKG